MGESTVEPKVLLVEIHLCELCLGGAGGECHVPGCALYLRRAPDIRLDKHWANSRRRYAMAGKGKRRHRPDLEHEDGMDWAGGIRASAEARQGHVRGLSPVFGDGGTPPLALTEAVMGSFGPPSNKKTADRYPRGRSLDELARCVADSERRLEVERTERRVLEAAKTYHDARCNLANGVDGPDVEGAADALDDAASDMEDARVMAGAYDVRRALAESR